MVMDEEVAPDREALIRNDPYCAFLGIELVSIGSGSAATRLSITEDHLNFHGVPHGGAINSLADAAFAAASNADGDDAFALETNVSFLEAVEVGTTLTATARRTHETRQTGEYEVVVTADTDDGGAADEQETAGDPATDDRIATFRGRVYRP
ncbi:hypothetical protein C479_12349 [Halovivax asiaticus JCM 14624]|uniref:Thioesterase domain-containing protein n=1 Tax=Halovivax asiaticus JCM 14624 TaxID=1227490 RepID=M0BDD9_9EURY|nr:hypothetical protein C479_12349 [Halovivax asiaticus JCM 14624]